MIDAGIAAGDRVVEIGAGLGSLTVALTFLVRAGLGVHPVAEAARLG